MSETKRRARYTLEYKLEAVRLVKGGQAVSVTAKILGPRRSLYGVTCFLQAKLAVPLRAVRN